MTKLILGIETSCDETAAAVVGSDRTILSNIIHGQFEDHKPYGGVVPEIAARSHIRFIDRVIERALEEAGVTLNDINGIAATSGPGLIGGVMVGMMAAKGLAQASAKPFLPVNHLEGHILTADLTDAVPFPYLCLLISGGHTQFVLVQKPNDYICLGRSIDDALGEAFDKTAKILGLGYPGGPALERLADLADSDDIERFDLQLPRPLFGRSGSDFSFSGLKTAVLQTVEANQPLSKPFATALARHFHQVIAEILTDRTEHAVEQALNIAPECSSLVVAGGVAANAYIRRALRANALRADLEFVAPPLDLCTDNAAMIAWAGYRQLDNLSDKWSINLKKSINSLGFKARPRWPVDPLEQDRD